MCTQLLPSSEVKWPFLPSRQFPPLTATATVPDILSANTLPVFSLPLPFGQCVCVSVCLSVCLSYDIPLPIYPYNGVQCEEHLTSVSVLFSHLLMTQVIGFITLFPSGTKFSEGHNLSWITVCLCICIRLCECACMCAYLYACTYKCVHVCLHVHAHMHTCVCVTVHVCVCVCMHIWVCACMHACVSTHVYVWMCVHVCSCLCVDICVCMCGWVYMCCAHAYICECMQMHVCVCETMCECCVCSCARGGCQGSSLTPLCLTSLRQGFSLKFKVLAGWVNPRIPPVSMPQC